MQYADWTNAIMTILEVPIAPVTSSTGPATTQPSTDAQFNLMIPSTIWYVENRLCRDLDFISEFVADSSATTAANSRTFTYPTDLGTFVVVQQLALFVGGVRQPPMTPVSREFLDGCWPTETAPSTPSYPTYWAWYNGTSAIVGPAPDAAYTVEVLGTIRPVELSGATVSSPGNPSNFLSTLVPDLYVAASVSYLATYLRDYGISSDDPHLAPTWETQYQTLLKGAMVEELRKKFAAQGGTSRFPSSIQTPPQK